MLDHFLNASYSRQQQVEADAKLASALDKLPPETLYRIATGTEKVAYSSLCGPNGSGNWLDRFKGTPLFEKAFEIEQADLQLEMEEQAARAEEQQARDMNWSARSTIRDSLGVQRKMLDLELAALEEGVNFSGDGVPSEGEPPLAEDSAMAPELEEGVPPEEAPETERRPTPPRKETAPVEKEASERFRVACFKLAAEKSKQERGSMLPGLGESAGRGTGKLLGMTGGAGAGYALERASGIPFLPTLIGGTLGWQAGGEIGGRLGHAAGRGLDRVLPTKEAAAEATAERSKGRLRGAGRDAAIGGVGGLAAGALLDRATRSKGFAANGALYGTGLGALVGAARGSKEAAAKVAFGGALLRGVAGSARASLPTLGQSMSQAGRQTVGAFQRGGLQSGLRTAGRSALTLAAKHPTATVGAAGLGAGMMLGKAAG